MTYSKPEVNILGEAKNVIERTGQKVFSKVGEAPFMPIILNPAYDLDD